MRPVGTVFGVSAAAAMLVTAIDVIRLARGIGLARVSDLEFVWFLRHLFERFDMNLLAYAPGVVVHPFELDRSGIPRVLVLGGLTVLALHWVVAGAVAPFVAVARRRWPSWTGWQRGFPLAVVAAFLIGPLYGRVHQVIGLGSVREIQVTAAVGVLVWIVLMRVVRTPRSVAVLVRGLVAAAIGLGGGALIAMAAIRPADVAQAVARRGAPNVLLVSIDSLRRDHVHAYGYGRDTTPVIDGLAAEGTRFETVVAPTPWTLPSHLTLLTSLPPEVHGVVDDGLQIRRESTTFLTQVLWDAGYATAGFVSGPYLDASNGFSQGFEHYDDYTVAKQNFDASHRSITSPALVRLVSEWLTGWNDGGRQRPFFLFVHMWDVHYDYTPPPPYDTLFDPDYAGHVNGVDFLNNPAINAEMDPRDLAHVVALYDGEIRFTDEHLGRILAQLRALGVLDETLVVVTADHGDEFFEHGHKGHAKVVYDESVLVPLVMRFPGHVPAGRTIGPQVRLMDVAPTILSLVGVPPPRGFGMPSPKVAGAERDLVPLMAAEHPESLPEVPAFSGIQVADAPRPLSAIRTRTRKLIEGLHDPTWQELYDLETDPSEQRNLVRSPADDGASLRSVLGDWRAQWTADRARRTALTSEQRARLRALGYLN
ncbi:MAG: sulfatase [Candidatus Binatia bacterium]